MLILTVDHTSTHSQAVISLPGITQTSELPPKRTGKLIDSDMEVTADEQEQSEASETFEDAEPFKDADPFEAEPFNDADDADDADKLDKSVDVPPAIHCHCICALCNLCLRCGDPTVSFLCKSDCGFLQLKTGIFKDISVLATNVTTFLQHCNHPLPKLQHGQYLPKVKLCSVKGNGCHKRYSNWKASVMGKASAPGPLATSTPTRQLPVTPQMRKKPAKSQKAPKKVKVSQPITILDPSKDAENESPKQETSAIKKESTVQLSVSLHAPPNSKGVSTVIESAKIVLPDVNSIEKVWDHLDKNLN
ncbi:hypothetical protein HDU80_002942, partial [Chytriomyces hyalinus]